MLVKVILFWVRVPVLSEQIMLAPPMVSHAYSFLTKLLSFNILFTLKAKDKVTDKGKPSGIATTTTVTPIIKKFNISTKCFFSKEPAKYLSMENLTNRAPTMIIAEMKPNLPISSARFSSFFYKGVASTSPSLRIALILPSQLLSPTTNTKYNPSPVSILDPLIRTGEGISWVPI